MSTTRITERALRDAMRDRRYWNAADPERKDWVDWVTKGWVALENAPPPANGTTREVTVKAYTRRRNGRVEHVDSYTQTRQAANDSDDLVTPINAGGGSAPETTPPVQGNQRTLVIFVGGAGDELRNGPVRTFIAQNENKWLNFSHISLGQGERERLEQIISSEPLTTRIVIIGHSWGADTAAQAVAAAGERGRIIDQLVTIDPVGNGLSENFLLRVRGGTREWTNVRATGGSLLNGGNLIAGLGGTYGDRPRSFANRHIESAQPHARFGTMLTEPGPDGSIWDRLFNR